MEGGEGRWASNVVGRGVAGVRQGVDAKLAFMYCNTRLTTLHKRVIG